MLGVTDIMNDLCVTRATVLRWIREKRLKGDYNGVKHVGWRIEEADYMDFLDRHPKWKLAHDGEIYKKDELKVREDALLRISAAVSSIKIAVKTEIHDERYVQGVERAITDIQSAINKEMRKKMPEEEVKTA